MPTVKKHTNSKQKAPKAKPFSKVSGVTRTQAKQTLFPEKLGKVNEMLKKTNFLI